MGIRDVRPPDAHQAPSASTGTGEDSLTDSLVDPLAGPSQALPIVPLPSAFKPNTFVESTRARGARPGALKVLDEHLNALDTLRDPRERFDRLKALKHDVDDFVLRYRKEGPRLQVVNRLKTWLDGAIELRSDAFDDPR